MNVMLSEPLTATQKVSVHAGPVDHLSILILHVTPKQDSGKPCWYEIFACMWSAGPLSTS